VVKIEITWVAFHWSSFPYTKMFNLSCFCG